MVRWGFEITYSIGRVVATAAGNGDAKMLDMKQWEIQGYTGGMGYLNKFIGLSQECQKQDDKQPERTGNGKFSNYFIN